MMPSMWGWVWIFLVLGMGLWMAWERWGRPNAYGSFETASNIGCAILSEGAWLLFLPFAYGVFEALRWSQVPWNPSALLLGLLVADFGYYWFHRLSHRVWALWAIHAVHHQSERVNLSAGLRHGFFTEILAFPFYLPLALMGFNFSQFLLIWGVLHVYQIAIHRSGGTQHGLLSWIFVDRRDHLTHHGCNWEYLDCNFGGLFVFWDKLFGTYRPRTVPIVLGVTHRTPHWDPMGANVQVARDLWDNIQRHDSKDRWRALWKPPGWSPAGMYSGSVDPSRAPLPDSLPWNPRVRTILFSVLCLEGVTVLTGRWAGLTTILTLWALSLLGPLLNTPPWYLGVAEKVRDWKNQIRGLRIPSRSE